MGPGGKLPRSRARIPRTDWTRHNPQEPDDRQDFGKEVSHRLSAAGCPGQFHDKEHVLIRVACPQLVIGLPYQVLAGHQPNLFQHNRLAEIDF